MIDLVCVLALRELPIEQRHIFVRLVLQHLCICVSFVIHLTLYLFCIYSNKHVNFHLNAFSTTSFILWRFSHRVELSNLVGGAWIMYCGSFIVYHCELFSRLFSGNCFFNFSAPLVMACERVNELFDFFCKPYVALNGLNLSTVN